jgi:hypothetical protein
MSLRHRHSIDVQFAVHEGLQPGLEVLQIIVIPRCSRARGPGEGEVSITGGRVRALIGS